VVPQAKLVLGKSGAILRAVRDHKIIALGRVVADGCGSIVHDKHVFGIDELELILSHFLLHTGKCVDHALAKSQVILGTRHDNRHTEELRGGSLCGSRSSTCTQEECESQHQCQKPCESFHFLLLGVFNGTFDV
jgi:hypothetical protein